MALGFKLKSEMITKLREGNIFKVTLKEGYLGCSDAQDACKNYGHLILRYNNGNFDIDTPSDPIDGWKENLISVSDFTYIGSIVKDFEMIKSKALNDRVKLIIDGKAYIFNKRVLEDIKGEYCISSYDTHEEDGLYKNVGDEYRKV